MSWLDEQIKRAQKDLEQWPEYLKPAPASFRCSCGAELRPPTSQNAWVTCGKCGWRWTRADPL